MREKGGERPSKISALSSMHHSGLTFDLEMKIKLRFLQIKINRNNRKSKISMLNSFHRHGLRGPADG